jgi:transcriptional regulator with XRE-family HTH domain
MASDKDKEVCRLFGRHLVKLRNAKGWSQERLALESGSARGYLGDVERGLRNPALIKLSQLADALDVSMLELMDFQKKRK